MGMRVRGFRKSSWFSGRQDAPVEVGAVLAKLAEGVGVGVAGLGFGSIFKVYIVKLDLL